MVQIRNIAPRFEDGTINTEAWFESLHVKRDPKAVRLIHHAYTLAQLTGQEKYTFSGQSCLSQGLEIAEILLDLNCDHETIAAGLVYGCAEFAELTQDDIKESLGNTVARLVDGVRKMHVLHSLHMHRVEKENSRNQVDNLRKMLLAMAQDIRVVFIKLAERACVLRNIKNSDPERCKHISQEILDIYAPLANRLGIGQLKWEMEDLSFRYCYPALYKDIATQLQERRLDREAYVQKMIEALTHLVNEAGIIGAQVTGRVKHIFSIYRKMQRKKVDLSHIYDATAVRVLVPDIADCYAVLSAVHNTWPHIPEEFDDYVTIPKENGYQSIHTAVYGPTNKIVEVQIRTFDMHNTSELGMAAHWMYKEGERQTSSYQNKITWLRQIIDWQKEVSHTENNAGQVNTEVTEDRVYVITPAEDIVELPKGATPLDFAYSIHTEIGHRCRGAKVNHKIVPLTYKLATGDQIEILTQKYPNPSRDWLNTDSGYLISSSAKAKIHRWFKAKDYDLHVQTGRTLVSEELKRLALAYNEFGHLALKFNLKVADDLFAAIGNGDLRIGQIINAIRAESTPSEKAIPLVIKNSPTSSSTTKARDIQIAGLNNLLTNIAKCCKPIPGEPIQGFITKGHGISIHRNDCPNLNALDSEKQQRLIEVSWGTTATKAYPVDLYIEANHDCHLVKELSTLLSYEKIVLLALNSRCNRTANLEQVELTIEINDSQHLKHVMERIKRLSGVLIVNRQQ